MNHQHYVTRAGGRRAHLFYRRTTNPGTDTRSLCDRVTSEAPPAKPGDGRPVCKICAHTGRVLGLLLKWWAECRKCKAPTTLEGIYRTNGKWFEHWRCPVCGTRHAVLTLATPRGWQ